MRKTLLLADDSLTVQRVIEQTFADEPIDVVTVGDGAAALARLDADPPDVLLADIGMPGRTATSSRCTCGARLRWRTSP